MIWRAWIIFSTLIFSTLFQVFRKHGEAFFNSGEDWAPVHFLFSERILDRESWIYFLMQHLNEALIAFILLFKDNTPKFLLWLYFAILVADGTHFVLFFRDEGIGFNLIKVVTYGLALLYFQLKDQWTQLMYLRK